MEEREKRGEEKRSCLEMRFAYLQAFFFSREETALLPATQVHHPQPEQWSLMFPTSLRVRLYCYESELKPNALSIGKAAIDLSL